MSRWAVVVLSWNQRDETLGCLEALRHVDGIDMLVVADNGSADGTVEAVRAARPDAIVIENGANLGFSGGSNAGIRRALDEDADWVVLLNNDARPAPETIAELRAAAERHPRAGILAGRLLFDDGRVQWAGQRVDLRTGYSGRPDGYGRRDGPEWRSERPVERAVGALMAVSRPAIDAVAVHGLSASTGGDRGSTHTLYYGARNTIAVCERHLPLGRAGTGLRRLLVLAAFLTRAALVQRSRAGFAAVLSGYADARAGRFGERRATNARS